MSRLRAALAVLFVLAVLPCAAFAATDPGASVLTLEAAFARTLASHPDLRRLPFQRDVLIAESARAAQHPAMVAEASLENAFGSGEFSGLSAADLSLSLGSVIERGGKREARMALAQGALDTFQFEQEATRLDVLAEVARRYIDALAAQELEATSAASVVQRRDASTAAQRRFAAGAAPRFTPLAAEAAWSRAVLEESRAREHARSARRRLSLLWRESEPEFPRVAGDLRALPHVDSFDQVVQLLQRAPELRRFASEARLREARLQLARSSGKPDVDWQIGVRRLQQDQDLALIGSVSIPLGSRHRVTPGIRAAEAELAQLDLQRESGEMSLYATLADAHGRVLADGMAVRSATADILPKLEHAEIAARQAYVAGALSYLELAQTQADLLDARRDQIEAARDFHRALIEIQRLTGNAFIALPDQASKEKLP